MSFRGAKLHFEDMMRAISLVEEFLGAMTFAQYQADARTRSVVERQLQIITEAAHRLSAEDEALCPDPNWKDWRGMGNLLRHAYHRIDDAAIWDTLTTDLPSMKRAVQQSLKVHFAVTE